MPVITAQSIRLKESGRLIPDGMTGIAVENLSRAPAGYVARMVASSKARATQIVWEG